MMAKMYFNVFVISMKKMWFSENTMHAQLFT